MVMNYILHITSSQAWEIAKRQGSYRHDSLNTEGFIHCSRAEQVVRVANFLFAGQSHLILLCIDSDRLQSELRYDRIETGEIFPHVYGEINLDAIVRVVDFEPDAQGRFELPQTLRSELGEH